MAFLDLCYILVEKQSDYLIFNLKYHVVKMQQEKDSQEQMTQTLLKTE